MAIYSETEIRDLLRREEGQYLEFKSLWDRSGENPVPLPRRKVRDWIAEYAAAFANADGGMILLGVEDDGTPSGHAYPEEVIDELVAVPSKRLRSSTEVREQRLNLDGQPVVLIEIRSAPEAVMVEGNGFPYRTGDRIIREPQEIINDRKQAYRQVGYESRVRPEATVEDLDLELASSFLRSSVVGDRPLHEILEWYSLILPKAGGHAVTNAALLLFAHPPLARWHPRAGVRVFRVDGTERLHGSERNVRQLSRIEQPLARAIPAAHRFMAGQIRRSERLHSLFFRETPEYPEFAWQEALVNAVAHRDYGDQGREIEVWFYADRLEVKSPGDLVPPVTLDALRAREAVHASRNPLVVRVLVECGIMREEGEGIPRMFEEMEEALLRLPSLSLQSSTFTVCLSNQPIFDGPSDAWQHLVDVLDLTTSQRRVLLAEPDGFTNESYRRLNRVDRDQAYREIQELVQKGVVLPAEPPGRGAVYRTSPDLLASRQWLESRVPELKTKLREQPAIQNADYREMFGVTRSTAVKELRRLVDSGFLVLEGERRGAHYEAGSALRLGDV